MYRNDHYGPIDKFCARHPGFGVPNQMLYIGAGQIIVWVLGFLIPSVYDWLPLYAPLVLQGQIWRLISFVFIPNSSNPFYLLLGCYFYFWIGQMLEREWGAAKFTLFYLFGVVLTAVYGMTAGSLTFYGYVFPLANIYYVNLSIFLIIATYYGEMQVLLFFVVPVKMKWMAIVDVVLVLMEAVPWFQRGIWIMGLAFIPSIVNYFIFTWPFWFMKLGFLKRKADPQVINFKKAQRQAQKKVKETGGWFHKCAVCGVTDAIEPDMEFRYCSKCDGYYCYCANHINNHIHIRQD